MYASAKLPAAARLGLWVINKTEDHGAILLHASLPLQAQCIDPNPRMTHQAEAFSEPASHSPKPASTVLITGTGARKRNELSLD